VAISSRSVSPLNDTRPRIADALSLRSGFRRRPPSRNTWELDSVSRWEKYRWESSARVCTLNVVPDKCWARFRYAGYASCVPLHLARRVRKLLQQFRSLINILRKTQNRFLNSVFRIFPKHRRSNELSANCLITIYRLIIDTWNLGIFCTQQRNSSPFPLRLNNYNKWYTII